MKWVILLLIFLAVAPFMSEALLVDVFQIELSYDSGSIQLGSVKLAKTLLPPESQRNHGSYGIEVISYKNIPLWESRFRFPLEIMSDPDISCYDENMEYDPNLCEPGNPSYVKLESADTVIYAPYYPAADRIDISSPGGGRVLSIDVSGFSCGNGFCDPKEDLGSCPEDCSFDRQMEIIDRKSTEITSWFIMVITVLVIVGVAVALAMYVVIRARDKDGLPDVGHF